MSYQVTLMTLGLYILDDNGLAIPCDDRLQWANWLEANKFKDYLVDRIAGIRVLPQQKSERV